MNLGVIYFQVYKGFEDYSSIKPDSNIFLCWKNERIVTFTSGWSEAIITYCIMHKYRIYEKHVHKRWNQRTSAIFYILRE